MADSSLKLFAVVHLSPEDEWEERAFFIGTWTECKYWVRTNCFLVYRAGSLYLRYGTKDVSVLPILEEGVKCS